MVPRGDAAPHFLAPLTTVRLLTIDRITALVTGADHPTGLGAARALRAAGAVVIGLTHRPDQWCCRSRAWSEVVAIDVPTPMGAMDALVATAERLDGPVFVLPAGDTMVRWISRNRERLPAHARTVLPPDPVVELLLEKTRFAGWAEEHGYPVPRSLVATSPDELQAAAEKVRFPAVIKPLVRTAGWSRASPVDKAIRLDQPDDLTSIPFDLFEAAPSYVISEWIPGADDDVLFCLVHLDRNSDVVASFTGRKLLQYPRLTGSTAICIDRADPELEEMTASLFKEAGCTGLASLEVKRSATDGRYLITEPTVGRPNLQSAAAVLGGVNLHGIAMRDAWGRNWDDLLGRRRRCYWIEEHAMFELLTTTSEHRLPLSLMMKEALAGRRIGGAYLRLGDWRPFASMSGHWLRRGARRLFRGPNRRLPDAPRA